MAKKFKRMLSAALATVLCVSSLSLTAFADNDQASTNINKTATALDDKDQTEVTLSVPGEAEVLGSDIIYIVGSYASNEDGTPNVEGDVLISSLMDTIKEMVEMGTVVNFGMVPFSSDNVVAMPLTAINQENIDALPGMIANALATCEALYDGVNMENALIKSKKMFSESSLADHPERQHLVMITSGFTYFFNSGENNEYVSTVPVNFVHTDKTTVSNQLFYTNKAWQRARTAQTNTYPLPKVFTQYQDSRDWDLYWSYIDAWSKADIAAGDKVVYEATTIDAGDFLQWLNSGSTYAKNTTFGYNSHGAYITDITGVDLSDYVTMYPTENPLAEGSNSAHAILYERAMWEAYEYAKANITGAGINFYPIYNALKHQYSNGFWADGRNGKDYAYGVDWTNQYIGHSFVNMLAGSEAVMYDKAGDKTFFDPIKNKIIYHCSKGSTVEDFIGYDEVKGNFEFIKDAATITLKKSGLEAPYTTSQIDTKEGADASYAFTAPGADKPTFWLDYYYGDGKTTEKFIWTFGEDVSRYVPVSLTYKLQLTEKSEEAGTHVIDTNLSATLYPKDSYGEDGTPEIFPVPKVSYEVVPYDVDIVIALGAGIAQYDADGTKGTNTYDSIIALVEPLVNKGINVKLGLVAVEHYDDVAMSLEEGTLTKENYKEVITAGLNKIQSMPAGPTNLEGNILAAKTMLDADTSVPAANKFFHVIATGRTYCFDDANGNPATIINKVALKGSTYYYWGHYLWQSQRGGHTSLYMIPARYNNDWDAYWADVNKWIEADGDAYVYSFPAYDTTNENWYKDYSAANTKDAKALKLASSRFGWILQDETNSGLAAIGSGSNPQNALNYERGQYDAYQAYQAMKDAGYNCYALCSESVNYQNGSPYIQVAKYTGTSTIQLGHSFMNFLAGGEATVLFQLEDNNGNYKMLTNFFEAIDMEKLVKSTELSENTVVKLPMLSTGPSVYVEEEVVEETEEQPVELAILTQPQDAEAALGETVSVTVEAQGEGLKYQWYFRNAGAESFSKSGIKEATYSTEMNSTRAGREIYCVITDAQGNKLTSDTVKLIRVAKEELAIITQPTDAEAAIGETVSTTVKAQGEGLKYRWYFRNAGAKSFSASSITTDTYSAEMNKTRAGREVYCVISDALGNKVTTDTVKLIRVAKEELAIITQPTDAEAAIGEEISVTVEAQGEGLKYRWYFRNAGATKFSASSITTDTYATEMNKARANREIYCVITDALGNKVTTVTVTLICK